MFLMKLGTGVLCNTFSSCFLTVSSRAGSQAFDYYYESSSSGRTERRVELKLRFTRAWLNSFSPLYAVHFYWTFIGEVNFNSYKSSGTNSSLLLCSNPLFSLLLLSNLFYLPLLFPLMYMPKFSKSLCSISWIFLWILNTFLTLF